MNFDLSGKLLRRVNLAKVACGSETVNESLFLLIQVKSGGIQANFDLEYLLLEGESKILSRGSCLNISNFFQRPR